MQDVAKGVPRDFELVSQRKGFKRFTTDELRGLVKQRAGALEEKEAAMAGIRQACLSALHNFVISNQLNSALSATSSNFWR